MKISLPEKFLRWQLGTSLLLALGAEDQKCSKYKSLAKTLVQMKSTYQFCFCAKDQNKFEAYVVKMSNRKWKLYKDKVTAVYKFTFFLNFISFQVVKRCSHHKQNNTERPPLPLPHFDNCALHSQMTEMTQRMTSSPKEWPAHPFQNTAPWFGLAQI